MGSGVDAVVLGGRERIPDLEMLYRELHAHHVAVAPRLAGLTERPATESWARRRARYEEWLAQPGAFVVVAEREGVPVGFALVTTETGYQSWASGDLVGEIHDLVIANAARRDRIGSALMDEVERQLAARGIREYRLLVLAANSGAVEFYASREMTVVSHVMLGRVKTG